MVRVFVFQLPTAHRAYHRCCDVGIGLSAEYRAIRTGIEICGVVMEMGGWEACWKLEGWVEGEVDGRSGVDVRLWELQE